MKLKKILIWSIVIIISLIVYIKTLVNGYHNYNESLVIYRLCIVYISNLLMLFGIAKIFYHTN